MTTQKTISTWFDMGVEQGATYMIVICDTYDWKDYPIFVFSDEDIHERNEHYNKNMQKVMEIYNLRMKKQPQIKATRTFQY